MSDPDKARAAKLLHHSGPGLAKGDPVAVPLVQSTMFHLPGNPADADQYGRYDNPTWRAAEDAIALLEDASALLFPSGMAAISAALFPFVKSGDRILLPSDGYYTTRILAVDILSRFGIVAETCPTAEMAIKALGEYALVFIETPSNPGLDVIDIQSIATRSRQAGALLVADNTTMTPFGQRPLDLGADIVVSADTKAMNGHSDILAGHVASRDPSVMEQVAHWRKVAGSIAAPHDAWLLLRGMATLELRLERMCTNALVLANELADHPAVKAIRYPGLANDPSNDIAKRQMQSHGFLIGLTLSSEDTAETFIESCPLIKPATSFGGVHTSAERRARWGDDVDPAFIRLSVGCEPIDPLRSAILGALDNIG